MSYRSLDIDMMQSYERFGMPLEFGYPYTSSLGMEQRCMEPIQLDAGTSYHEIHASSPFNSRSRESIGNDYMRFTSTENQHQRDRKEAARRWQCNLCDRRFDKRADIHRHQASVHRDRMDSPPELYHCPHEDCNRRDRGFPRIDNFKEHLKRVHNDYEYTKIHYGR